MNLFDQLVQANNLQVQPTANKRPWTLPNLLKGNGVRANNAKTHYKKFLTDWVKTSTLEARMGYATNSCTMTLKKLLSEGLVERRPVGEVFSRKTGYEWRWVCPKNSGTV